MKRNVFLKAQFISFEVYKNIQNAKIVYKKVDLKNLQHLFMRETWRNLRLKFMN